MDEVNAEELSEVLKPLGIVLKQPYGFAYEMWTKDGLRRISPSHEDSMLYLSASWYRPSVLARDLCNERNKTLAIVGIVSPKVGPVPYWPPQTFMDNPFCGCKSLDEMRIARDLAGI